jgi:hypothetical protein
MCGFECIGFDIGAVITIEYTMEYNQVAQSWLHSKL